MEYNDRARTILRDLSFASVGLGGLTWIISTSLIASRLREVGGTLGGALRDYDGSGDLAKSVIWQTIAANVVAFGLIGLIALLVASSVRYNIRFYAQKLDDGN